MARGYAQIFATIWSDDDFRSLSPYAQRQYFLLVSQPDINYAGVLPLVERRWARCCEETSLADVQAATAELSDRRYVIVDYDTEELLVRSFMRRDELWKQPRMLSVAVREALATASGGLREALAEELRRIQQLIPVRDPVDSRVTLVENAINNLMRGPAVSPTPPPPQGVGRGKAKASGGLPARAPGTGTNTKVKPKPLGAATNLTQERARNSKKPPQNEEMLAMPSIPESPPGPAVTGPTAGDAYRLVDSAIGREHPHSVRTALAIEVGALLLAGTTKELLFAALTLWLDKPNVGPRTLPSLVSEVIKMRNRSTFGSRPSTTDQRIAAAQALKNHPSNVNQAVVLRAIPGGAS